MSTAQNKRFLIDDASRGSWNMAVDEFLLLRAVEANDLAIRIYRWEEPTVSLGYFQDSSEFHASGQIPGLPVVRRLSGGGAILHDREITYSIALSQGHSLAADPIRLYEAAHAGITGAIGKCGVTLAPRGTSLKQEDEPFLCFSRGDHNDLMLNGVKVVGSAQRRRKGAVLQHGSILLEASPHAPELPGIRDLVPSFEMDESLPDSIGEAIFHEVTGTRFETSDAFSENERSQIQELEETRYRDVDQLRNRTPGDQPA